MRAPDERLEGRSEARTVVVILRERGDDGDLSGGRMHERGTGRLARRLDGDRLGRVLVRAHVRVQVRVATGKVARRRCAQHQTVVQSTTVGHLRCGSATLATLTTH